MGQLWKKLWRILPAVLAFALLAFQIAIPWTVPHFVTQDGPSHLYTAIVAKKLLFHDAAFRFLYHVNPHTVPSWGSTILLGLCAWIVGAAHAEQLMMSLCLCAGFFSLSYALWALSPEMIPFTPLSNAVLETWFLWVGFYNFYLGIVLVPLAIGFYVRRNGRLTARAGAALALGLVMLFYVHLLAAAIAMLTLGTLAVWLHILRPVASAKRLNWRDQGMQLGMAFALMIPVLLYCWRYARNANQGVAFSQGFLSSVAAAWLAFPMHTFATANGLAGGQWYLWPALLALLTIGALGMRSCEWRTAKGAMAISAAIAFLLYLIAPDTGLGGNQVKVRFAWVVFFLGILVVASVARLQPLQTPIAIFVAVCVAFNLTSTLRTVHDYSVAVEAYLAGLKDIPPGATVIRVRYPMPDLPERYRFHEIGRDPLLHLDAYAAACAAYIDLSDYQAPTADFPIVFKPRLDHDQQFMLLRLDNPRQDESATLDSLRDGLPVKIDYAILLADQSSPDGSAIAKVMADLESSMRLVAQSPAPPFARVYQRIGARIPNRNGDHP